MDNYESKIIDDNEGDYNEENWKILITINNNIEQQIIVSILESESIPCIVKSSQIDSLIKVLVGFPIGGVDILVPEDRFVEANELLSNRVALSEDCEFCSDDEVAEDK